MSDIITAAVPSTTREHGAKMGASTTLEETAGIPCLTCESMSRPGGTVFSSKHKAMLGRMGARLLSYAFALTHDRDRAADLVQDGIVRALASQNIPEDEPAFRVWLCRIIRNCWIDQWRVGRRQDAAASDGEARSVLGEDWSGEDMVLNGLAVRQAYFALSQNHRDVLALVDIVGFSYEETSKILSVTRGTIMSRVSRARQALALRLSESEVVPFPRTRRSGRDG